MDVLERLNNKMLEQPETVGSMDGWRIEDMGGAAWASRKMLDTLENMHAIDAWEEEQITRIKLAARNERQRFERDEEFFRAHLGDYLRRLVDEGRKTKTLDLPGGTVRLREGRPTVDIHDDAAIAWAEANSEEDFLRRKVELNRVEFKKHITLNDDGSVVFNDTGEVLDFVRWSPSGTSVTFTPIYGGEA